MALANVRISNLPTTTSGVVVDTDILPIVVGVAGGTGVTSRITVSELRLKLGTNPPAGGRTVTSASTYLANNAVFNVKDFGAIGNGAIDDTTALQAAINAAHAATYGGIAYFPEGTYKITVALTLYANVSIKGADMETTTIAASGAITAILLQPGAVSIVGRISDIIISGQIASSLFGLDLKNVLFLVLERVEITGFKSGNIRCLDFGQVTLRDVFVGGGGDATHPNVLFDSTGALGGTSNGLYCYNFTISGGGASSVAGLRIERTQNVQYYGGALESAGVLLQISATNDGTDGYYCANVNFYGTDFENASGKYIEAGTAWNIGLGTIALKQFSINGVTGTLSGSTTSAIGVALRLVQGFTAWNHNFILGTVGTAVFDIVSTVSGVIIGPCPNATLAGGIYIRSGGTDTSAAVTDVYTSAGYRVVGDLNAAGGYRTPVDGWYQNAVAANQNNVVLPRLATAVEVPSRWIAPRSGSVTAVWIKSDSPRTAGTCTVFVFKNNASISFSAKLDGSSATFTVSTAVKDVLTFAAGDELDIRIATDAGWLPTTANIRAGLEVET